MKGQFYKLQYGALAVAAVCLGASVFCLPANAQGRHGGSSGSSSTGSSRSSSSSSSRSSSGSSSSRSSSSNSGPSRSSGSSRSSSNSSRSINSSSSSSTSSRSSSSSSGSGRGWGHRSAPKGDSSRGAKRDKGSSDGNAVTGGNGSRNNRANAGGRNSGGDSTSALTSKTNERARMDDPEGRRGRDRGRDKDKDKDRDPHRGRFGPGTRFRGGDRAEWHRHECERGRYYYPTTIYYASNYDNYSYGPSAYDRGYEDGLFTGANDAWRGESFDPERSHFYKHGAGGFLSIFGGPSWYKAAYRDGFLRGYEEGFQNYTSYFVDGRFRR